MTILVFLCLRLRIPFLTKQPALHVCFYISFKTSQEHLKKSASNMNYLYELYLILVRSPNLNIKSSVELLGILWCFLRYIKSLSALLLCPSDFPPNFFCYLGGGGLRILKIPGKLNAADVSIRIRGFILNET